MVSPVSIRREAAISVVVNGVLSTAFFLGIYGTDARPLSWVAPDDLAFDFIPQSVAVALMSALVPAMLARKRLGNVHALRPVLIRAALFAVVGGLLGGALAAAIGAAALPSIGWRSALTIKMVYGGALGALVATLALRRLMSPVRATY